MMKKVFIIFGLIAYQLLFSQGNVVSADEKKSLRALNPLPTVEFRDSTYEALISSMTISFSNLRNMRRIFDIEMVKRGEYIPIELAYIKSPGRGGEVPIKNIRVVVKQCRLYHSDSMAYNPKGPSLPDPTGKHPIDVIAHVNGNTFPIGYVYTGARGRYIVIPAEILPCEIEFKGYSTKKYYIKD